MARGDERRDPLIALRIPPALDQQLRADVEARGTTITEVVRGLLDAHYAKPPEQRGATQVASIGKRPNRIRVAMCEHRVTVGNYCRKCNRTI